MGTSILLWLENVCKTGNPLGGGNFYIMYFLDFFILFVLSLLKPFFKRATGALAPVASRSQPDKVSSDFIGTGIK